MLDVSENDMKTMVLVVDRGKYCGTWYLGM